MLIIALGACCIFYVHVSPVIISSWPHVFEEIVGSPFAFAAIRADGHVVTWGTPNRGGDSRAVAEPGLKFGLAQSAAVRAVKVHNSILVRCQDASIADIWKDFIHLMQSYSQFAQEELRDVISVVTTNFSFAALRANATVVTWGEALQGGDSDMAAGICWI